MNKTKLIILTTLTFILLSISSIAYCSSLKSDIKDVGTDIKIETQKMGNDIKNTTNSLKNDISTGMNNMRNSTTASTNYDTNRVGYTDSFNMFGISMQKSTVVLLAVSVSSIIIAIMIFSYIMQDNNRYTNDDNY